MRRLALVFAVITLLSTALRIVTAERIVTSAANTARAPERFRNAVARACLFVTKRLRPLLPQAN
ncbi:MAG: hypothetical protein ABUS49_09640 [Acidobacteriota bacterium]